MNKHEPLFTIIFSTLLGIASVGSMAEAEEASAKKSSEDFKRHFEEHQRGLNRQVEIAPKENGGVNSGLIIVFGHAIKPPYKIEFKDDRMLVNGIVVKPSLIQQRESPKPRNPATPAETASAHEITALMKWAEDTYRAKKGTIPDDDLEKQITDYVKAQKVVKDAKWASKDRMDVLVDDGSGPFNLGIKFSKTVPLIRSEEEIKTRTHKSQESAVRNLEAQLGRGECIVFTTDGGETGCGMRRDEKKFRSLISGVMENTQLSQEQKISKVREIVGDDLDASLDIIANYHSDEWKGSAR